MARKFTNGTVSRLHVATAGLNGLNFTWGTAAFCLWPDATGFTLTVWTTNANVGPCLTLFIDNVTTLLWDGTNDAFAQAITTDEPCVIAFTKATGSVTARMHTYRFSTRTWVHQNCSTISVDSATVTEFTIGGQGSSSNNQGYEGEMWAAGLWPNRVWTDSEIERLAGGSWLNYAPAFYEQFTDWMEPAVPMTTSLGVNPSRSTTLTVTSRGAVAPPPGFRMDARRRRR